MAGATFRDRLLVAGLVAERGASWLRWHLCGVLLLMTWLRLRAPDRLLIAPQDIRTTDPTLAADIYAGYFAFGGKIVNAHGRSPFDVVAPSDEWARAVASFKWLRHLRAADTALARANARALVDDFLTFAGRPRRSPAWEPQVAARRLLGWLSQSPVILDGADSAFYRRFMRGIGRTRAFLERRIECGLAGTDRLAAAVALAELDLCAEEAAKARSRGTRVLVEELDRQILGDGGHISRNPSVLIELLLDLLPLRQAYAARGMPVPAQLLNSIDRIMPMLRLLRHGDATLALFNGMGVTPPEDLATILAYDDVRAQPLTNAPHSGYQRVEGRDTILIVDTGSPPPRAYSELAHAGCASFELSVGAERFVVNCGAPDAHRPSAREAARVTAAHSTLILDDTSSCRFASHAGLGNWLGGEIISGPDRVAVERIESLDGTILIVSHDGYERRFGFVHERCLVLAPDGASLAGRDRLRPARPAGPIVPRPFAVRFHIHPHVRMKRIRDGRGVLCVLPDGRRWLFESESGPAEIEESIFFAALDGPRASAQIALHGVADGDTEVDWSFRRVERKRQVPSE